VTASTRRRAIAAFAGAFGAAALGGAHGAAAADDLAPIQIGTITIDPCMQPIYAQEQGFFKSAGIDPKITVLNNSSAAVAALAAGSIDIASASVPVAAFAHQHGIPIRFIAPAGIYTGPPGNTILMIAKTSTIKSGADLNGKTVALGALRDMTQFETSSWIDKNGGDSKTVRLIELPYAQMPVALAQGRADAAALIEPFITSAKATSRVLANLSDTIGGAYLVSGWVSTDDWIRRNPDLLRRFVAVMQKAAIWANAHQKDSADILVRYTKIPPDVAATMNRIRYDEGTAIDPLTVQRPVDMLVKYGSMPPVSAKDMIATS
jgi:NitT/TauT family transport system substrate-binding protein